MKKLIALLLVISMVACLFVGCSGDEKEDPKETEKASESNGEETPAVKLSELGGKISFVTDTGNIDDKSFNQYSYEGVTTFGAAHGIDTAYYRPTEDSDAARIAAIQQAIDDGSKIVVMAGFLFGAAVKEAATNNPNTLFLALDVTEGDLGGEVPSNVALITYQEEQAGYLAGYAAVKAGYTQLGFLGGIDVPAVVRYGYGFVQGADKAAAEGGIQGVNIKYWYSGSFQPTDEIQTKMSGWYTEGTQVVFACGGGIYSSAVGAAEANNGKVIGVDVDQSPESELIITSAMKALSNSVQVALLACGENNWAWTEAYAGKQVNLGAKDNCVGLPMETSDLGAFDQAAYDTLFAALAADANGEIVSSSIEAAPAVTAITVDYQ